MSMKNPSASSSVRAAEAAGGELLATRIGVVGLGYVGLPLAIEFARRYRTIGFDLSQAKVAAYRAHIQKLATPSDLKKPEKRAEMAQAMGRFIRMYEPHAAREDTVLFPAFAQLITEKELHALMDTFEQKEKALPLGDFEKMVADVTAIEKAFGMDDLARFTPASGEL